MCYNSIYRNLRQITINCDNAYLTLLTICSKSKERI